MKNKIKNILIFIMGGIVFSIIGVIGSNVITATQVGINSSKTTKTNIQDAIDELYTFVNKYKKGNIEMAKTGDTYKAIVYLDPTDLSKSCNKDNSVSTSMQITGCMKWYAFSETAATYDLLLDHNIYFGDYPSTLQQLEQLKTADGWKDLNPRLISAYEVANIVGKKQWVNTDQWYTFDGLGQSSVVNSTIKSKYHWLYDYLDCYNYGCIIDYDNETTETNTRYGYWTSDYTCLSNDSNCSEVWNVGRGNNIWKYHYTNTNFSGLRPVITVSKSSLGL